MYWNQMYITRHILNSLEIDAFMIHGYAEVSNNILKMT